MPTQDLALVLNISPHLGYKTHTLNYRRQRGHVELTELQFIQKEPQGEVSGIF